MGHICRTLPLTELVFITLHDEIKEKKKESMAIDSNKAEEDELEDEAAEESENETLTTESFDYNSDIRQGDP